MQLLLLNRRRLSLVSLGFYSQELALNFKLNPEDLTSGHYQKEPVQVEQHQADY